MDVSGNKIKHLVCSGGGVYGFTFYGILKEAHKIGLWKTEDLISVYGTSVGTILLLLIQLKYTWEELDNYLINRPWQQVFPVDIKLLLASMTNRGIYDQDTIHKTLSPLLLGRNLSLDITMKELYEYSKIEFHCFSTEINSFVMVDISHITHPDWKVLDAIYCSSAFPLMFKPLIADGKCYSDGCVINNYPLSYCLEQGSDPDEILGIYCDRNIETDNSIDDDSSLFDYLTSIMIKTYIHRVDNTKNNNHVIRHEFCICVDKSGANDIYSPICKLSERLAMIESGVNIVRTKYSDVVDDMKKEL
jgi:NTE family protein